MASRLAGLPVLRWKPSLAPHPQVPPSSSASAYAAEERQQHGEKLDLLSRALEKYRFSASRKTPEEQGLFESDRLTINLLRIAVKHRPPDLTFASGPLIIAFQQLLRHGVDVQLNSSQQMHS
ncbi:hypothetical protein CF326_g9454 [Tilletia indica]|nr:hypothetical protein CF326_g9454 [Tilletia indica]